MSELTHGSLFAGFGMFDYAANKAGIFTKWTVENNEFCNKLLMVELECYAKLHHPKKTFQLFFL